jgi:phage shock protein PspC (stress-responsive transcriptional regulator)
MAGPAGEGHDRSMPKQTPLAPDTEVPPAPAPQPSRHRFFDWLRSLGLTRQPGWIGGVSAGIADRLGIDVLIVRGVLVVIAVLGGPAVLLYAAAWLLLPDSHDRIHLEDLLRGKVEAPVVAIAVLFVLALLPVAQGFWWFGSIYWGRPNWGDSFGRGVWSLIILGLLVWFIVWFSRRNQRDSTPLVSPATTDARPDTIPQPAVPSAPTPPPAPATDASTEQLAAWREQQTQWKTEYDAFRGQQDAEKQARSRAAAEQARAERMARAAAERAARARTRSHPLYSVILIGLALVAGGVAALAIGGGQPGPTAILAGIAVTVGVLGLGILVNGARGRRGGGATALAIVLLIPLAVAAVFPQNPNLRYSGAWHVSPTQTGGSDQLYVEGFGPVTLDLRGYFDAKRSAHYEGDVNLYLVAGNVTVLLPEGETVSIDAQTGRGAIDTDTGVHRVGGRANHWATTTADTDHASRVLDLEVATGSGRITIQHEPATTGAKK